MFNWLKRNAKRNSWYSQATKGHFKLPENPELINWHPNIQELKGKTVLWWAAFYNNRQAIDEFINAGANIDKSFYNGSANVIYWFTVYQHWDLVEQSIDSNLNLLSLYSFPTEGPYANKNILWLLASHNKWDLIEKILANLAVTIYKDSNSLSNLINRTISTDKYWLNVLSYAINNLNIDITEKLLRQGATISPNTNLNSLKIFINHLLENDKQNLLFLLIEHAYNVTEKEAIIGVLVEHANKSKCLELIKNAPFIPFEDVAQVVFLAAKMNDWQYVLQLLSSHKRHINASVKFHNLHLIEIAITNNYQAVKKLLKSGVNPNHVPNILWLTAICEQWDLVDEFLAKGIDIHAKCVDINAKGIDINFNPSMNEHKDKSILYIAANHKKLYLTEQLILKGVTIDPKFIEDHATEVLYWAIRNNKWQLAEKLIDANALLNDNIIKTKYNGETIAWLIAKSKKWDLLEKILSKYEFDLDATPEQGVDHGKTIMWFAADQHKWDLVDKLIDKGASVNAKATEGYSKGISVLWLVMSYREETLAKKLIKNNAELNVLPLHGLGLSKDKSILMWAIQHNYIEISNDIVIKLIEQGGLKLLVDNLKNVKPDEIPFIKTNALPPQKLCAIDFKTINEIILNDSNSLLLTLHLLNIFKTSCYTEESSINGFLGEKPIETNAYNNLKNFANTQKIKIMKVASKFIKGSNYEFFVIGNEIFLHEETLKNNTYSYGEKALLKILTIDKSKAYTNISTEIIRVAIIYLTKKDANYANAILKSILNIAATSTKDKLNKIAKVISHSLKPDEYLLYAARNNNKKLAIELIQEGATPNVKEKLGQHKDKSVLWWAVHYAAHTTPYTPHENSLIDELILRNVYIDEKVLIDYGSKLLSVTITNGHFKFAQKLVDLGVNVNSLYINNGCAIPPICYAVTNNNLEAAKFLIENSADVNITLYNPTKKEITTSLLASSIMNLQLPHVNCDMIKLLIANGANVNTLFAYNLYNDETFDFITPLALAFLYGNLDAIELLLAHNAKPGLLPLIILNKARHNKGIADIVEKYDSNYDLSTLTFKILLKHDCYREKHSNNKSYDTQQITTPETGDHDISFAKEELSRVKKHFQANNLTVSIKNPFIEIRDLIIKRIMNDAGTSQEFKFFLEQNKSKKQLEYDQLAPLINKNKHGITINHKTIKNTNYQALEWIMTYKHRMLFITAADYKYVVDLINEMLSYIISCIDQLKINGNTTDKSQAIEDALIFQLDNAMDAQEDRMSCAPGTPRFLRVVLEAYLYMVDTKYFDLQQYQNLQKSVQVVIDNMIRYQFKDMLKNKDISSITTIKKIESGMAKVCEALATIGTDNAEEIILGGDAQGRYSGAGVDVNLLKLRAHIMYKAFPSLESFQNAVISKMQDNPNILIVLNQTDEEYIKLMYFAISNNKIKEQLYYSFNSERTILRAQHAIIHAATTISKVVSSFRDAPFKNKMKLKNVLEQHIALLVGEGVNLEASHNVAENIIFNIEAKFDAQATFNKLKEMYDTEVLRLLTVDQIPARAVRLTP